MHDLSLAPHDPPPDPSAHRGRIVATAVTAVIFGALGGLAGAGFGIVGAILGGFVAAILGGLGAFAIALGRRWIGGGVLLVALSTGTCCGLSGLAYRGVQSMVPDAVALEAVETPGHAYLRHPSLGFLVGAPGEGFEDMSGTPIASFVSLAMRAHGESEGSWVWVSPTHGAQIFALAVRLPGEPVLATTRAFLNGFARGTMRPETVAYDPPFDRWDDVDHDVWTRAVGTDANGALAMNVRYRAWQDAQGTWHALLVAAKGHPDDDWSSYLLEMHTPGEPWRGPGVPPPGFTPRSTSLSEARASLTTELVREVRDDAPPTPPAEGDAFELTRYTSPAGSLAAYLTRNARGTERAPAVLFLHGGFRLDHGDIEPAWGARSLADAGLVVMVPATRGESGSDGNVELFLGELDDARAALEHLRAQPGVDPDHVVVMGHSSGATLALLLAETDAPARAYVAFGPVAEAHWMNAAGPDEQGWVYEPRHLEESWVRSPISFLGAITTPTWIVEGAIDSQASAAAQLRDAAPPGSPLQVIVPSGGDHFSLVRPVAELLAPRIRDRAPLTLTAAEVEAISGQAGAALTE